MRGTRNVSVSAFVVAGFLISSLVSGASCAKPSQVAPVAQNSDPNSAIEANIQKLREAQKRLSQDPRDKEALSVFITLLKDPNGINRANAASVLGEVGEENGAAIRGSAVPLLINMVEHGDGFDQYAALKALRGFGPHATEAIPILRANLASPVVQNTWIAAEALGRMKGAAAEAAPDLVRAIKANQDECLNDELNICMFAARALGGIGAAAKEASSDLTTLLSQVSLYTRIYVATALIRIQPTHQEALSAIGALSKDPNVTIRRLTLWELKDIGTDAEPAENIIKTALGDTDEAVRTAAAQILETFSRPR